MGYVNWNEEECKDFAETAKKLKQFDYEPWAREILELIKEEKAPQTVLDVGAGSGEMAFTLQSSLKSTDFILTDNAPGMEKIVTKRLAETDKMRFVHCSAEQLKLEDNTADIAICKHILTHVDDQRKALSEIFRVLKPNGTAIVIDFNSSAPLLRAMILFTIIRLKMGKERAAKFWAGYKKGIPSAKMTSYLKEAGFLQINMIQKGINYFYSAKKQGN